MVAQGVAPLHQGGDAALVEGELVDIVPTQAVGQGVILAVRRPQALHRPVGVHEVQPFLAQQVVSAQKPAEGGQVGGGGVEAAGAHDAHGVLGQGPGVLGGGVGLGQEPGVKVVPGGVGVGEARRVQNSGVEVVHKVHAAHRLHHQLGQGVAVVGVDTVGTGVGLEPLGGQPLQQIVGGALIGVAKEEGVPGGVPHEAGGVVQQHADGDVLVPLVGHGETGQVLGHRVL